LIGVAIVGFGVMGRRHAEGYVRAGAAGLPCQILAVCTRSVGGRAMASGGNLAQLAGDVPFDADQVRFTIDLDSVLEDPAIQAVSICTWTDSHVELALRAVAAGKHVLVEKPLAIRAEAMAALVPVAASAGTLCVPAMVMRWWPGWPWLRDQVRTGTFGQVRSATFQRLGVQPDWAAFYPDLPRSGGALTDLHVHDADFVRWCLSDPGEVFSTGTINHLSSIYRYGSGPPHVMAEGGWVRSKGFPFRMRYTVEFEDAVADFDVTRDPAVLLSRNGETVPVVLTKENPYDAEVRDFVAGILEGRRELRATVADAYQTARLLDAERESLSTGEPVVLSLPTPDRLT
jgi:predicted dehydrogenase